ncbi:MAG: hypothetical protein PHE09_11175 [Oscillospiraceae bacterium]|jgi:hypothetical protein|nr:hypothetical protein [Oscillospiraceae bacterium]
MKAFKIQIPTRPFKKAVDMLLFVFFPNTYVTNLLARLAIIRSVSHIEKEVQFSI